MVTLTGHGSFLRFIGQFVNVSWVLLKYPYVEILQAFYYQYVHAKKHYGFIDWLSDIL